MIANAGSYEIYYSFNHPAKEKLNLFSRFEDGWHLGEGRSFPQQIISQINELINGCFENNLLEIDVFPGLDADIRLTIYETPDYYEFTVGDSVSYCHEKNDMEQTYQEKISLHDAFTKIRDIGKKKWTLSESSVLSGSTKDLIDIKVLPSNAALGYPFLRSNAL